MVEVTPLPTVFATVEACCSAFLPLAGVAFLTAFLVTDSAAFFALGAALVLVTLFAAGALAAAFFAAGSALVAAFVAAGLAFSAVLVVEAFLVATAATFLAVSFLGRPGAFFFVTPVGLAPLAFGAAAFFFFLGAGC